MALTLEEAQEIAARSFQSSAREDKRLSARRSFGWAAAYVIENDAMEEQDMLEVIFRLFRERDRTRGSE